MDTKNLEVGQIIKDEDDKVYIFDGNDLKEVKGD